MKSFDDELLLWTERYYEHLKMHGYRMQSVRNYRFALQKFTEFAQREHLRSMEEITAEIIFAFQSELYHFKDSAGRPYAMRSQLAALSALKGFFKYLCDKEALAHNPALGLKMPKQAYRLPYVPGMEEITRLLASADTTKPLGFRDRTIMEVLYATAIRAQELCGLCLYDVDLEDNVLHIREGKGGKERVVPMGEMAAGYVQEYLIRVRAGLLQSDHYDEVFLSRYGKPLRKLDLPSILQKYRQRAGIEGKLTPHSLRHACASHLLKEGCDIRYIQQLLGHASLSTTQVYTRVEISDLKAMHERCHPREKISDV